MIILYSTGCPRCCVLARKMDLKNIKYKEVNDIDKVQSMGFHSVPILVVDDQPPMQFKEALDWINNEPTWEKKEAMVYEY